MPTVTIVIPCHNHVAELEACLTSVIQQTLSSWEAIVVDDASTIGDPMTAIVGLADPRIRLLRHEQNRGLAAARNTGFKAASAPLVLPLDSDDSLDPRCLERLVSVLEAEPSVDCVFPDLQLFGAASGVLPYRVRDLRALLESQWLPGPGTLMRKALWERAGGYCEDEELRRGNEDWDFYLSAAEAGLTARHVPGPLYHYRVSPGSMEMRLRYDNFRTREYIYGRHRALFDGNGGPDRFLADGYFTSASASAARGERRRALRLTWRALRRRPDVASALPIVARSLAPAPVMAVARTARRRLRLARARFA